MELRSGRAARAVDCDSFSIDRTKKQLARVRAYEDEAEEFIRDKNLPPNLTADEQNQWIYEKSKEIFSFNCNKYKKVAFLIAFYGGEHLLQLAVNRNAFEILKILLVIYEGEISPSTLIEITKQLDPASSVRKYIASNIKTLEEDWEIFLDIGSFDEREKEEEINYNILRRMYNFELVNFDNLDDECNLEAHRGTCLTSGS